MGTAKKGVHSAVTTRHVLSYVRPAGVKKTLLTVRDASSDPSQDQEAMHGDGSAAAIAIVQGDGNIEWSFSIAQHEYESAVVGVARTAGLTIEELIFNWVKTSVVDGLEKSTIEDLGCKIGSDSGATDPAGNRVELSGMAQNKRINGVMRFREAV
ncbi:MAG: hypothetical protein EKK62_03165 [Acidimicrobiia bacterium]|nr:MAG: hypothetical protein EKK62_03165 [Acidimicrobiia bacterium]